jgi:hypothetical protein
MAIATHKVNLVTMNNDERRDFFYSFKKMQARGMICMSQKAMSSKKCYSYLYAL